MRPESNVKTRHTFSNLRTEGPRRPGSHYMDYDLVVPYEDDL